MSHGFKLKKRKCVPAPIYYAWKDDGNFGKVLLLATCRMAVEVNGF